MLRIASGCATRDTFIAVFRRFCDGDSIFIATKTPKPKGAELRFAITLADGQPLIIGQGVVDRADTDNKGQFGRPGMRIKFVDVSTKSRELLDELAGKRAPVIPPIPLIGGASSIKAASANEVKADTPGAASGDSRKTILGMAPLSIPAIKSRGSAKPSRGAPPGVPPLVSKTRAEEPAAKKDPTAATEEPAVKDQPAVKDAPAAAKEDPAKSKDAGTPAQAAAPAEDPAAATSAAVEASATEPAAAPASSSNGVSSLEAASHEDDETSGWDDATDTRVRGGLMIVPANPLEELDAEALDAFVECTLYEDDGGFGEGEPTIPGDLDWLGEHTPPWDDPDPAPNSAGDAIAGVHGESPLSAATSASPAVDDDLVISRRRSHWPLTAAIAAGTAIIGILIGYAMTGNSKNDKDVAKAPGVAAGGSDSDSPTPTVAPPDAAPVEAVAGGSNLDGGAGEDEVADPQGDDIGSGGQDTGDDDQGEDDESLDDDGEPPSDPALAELVGTPLDPGVCAADVTSRPDVVAVYRDGSFVGRTPLRVVADCGVHEIELRHPRYQNQKRRIKLSAGQLKSMRVPLPRPDYKMRIGSVPRGATVKVNGKKVGITPLTTTIKGYQRMTVTVDKPGYKAWTKRVYAKKPMTSFTLKLNRGK